jgi:RNA polymerase sigma-70 factor (ECF subfamily)
MSSTVHKLVTRNVARNDASQDPPVLDLETVYAEWFHEVCRWIRALGGLDADSSDLAQEVFIVVRRKLPEFDGKNLKSWLYGITRRTVRDYRRAVWFRRLLLRKEAPSPEHTLQLLVEPGAGPAEQLERREAERCLTLILGKMNEPQRVAFILFEIEGYTGEEIAALEGVPLNTVWTRLRRARKEAEATVEKLRRRGEL